MNEDSMIQPSDVDEDARQESRAVDNAADALPERFQKYKQASDGVDSELVNKTKNQIRNLVGEITELAKSATELPEFFEGFLVRTTSALASEGGAVWLDKSGSDLMELQYHINVDQLPLANEPAAQARHSALLNKLRKTGEPALVPPNSGFGSEEEGGNPTDKLLVVGPLIVNGQTMGLVEIFQRPGAGPATQRGYLRFLTQMCEIASDYLKNHKLQNFGEQQVLWQQIDTFVREIHRGLDPEQTAYVIANEGRRIIDCDRVSVVLIKGGRCQIKAVSGLDSIERRADQVKQLQKLTKAIVKTNEPFWYSGDDENLPPQIEKRLHNYIDKSHTKMLAVIPLRDIRNTEEQTDGKRDQASEAKQEIIGALIVEQLKDSTIEPALRKRIGVVSEHSQTALSNAIEHNSLFLLPLWKALGSLAKPFRGSRLPRTLLWLGLFGGIAAFFALVPYPFTLSSNGQLQPKVQYEVYAKIGGILQEVLVPQDDVVRVNANDELARMTNNDLSVQIQNLEGQIAQTKEQIRSFQRANQMERQERLDAIMLDGQLNQEIESLNSLQRELELKQKQVGNLVVRSPANGVVVNWQVRKNLLKRPVDRGQNLMTVVDPSGGWQLELEIPERRIGHLLKRIKKSDDPVEVSFALVSRPGMEFSGKLVSVDEKLEVYSDDGNTAKAIVQFDNDQIPEDLLKSGTRINAKLNCGIRSIGFVWFHEMFETIETTYKYWF